MFGGIKIGIAVAIIVILTSGAGAAWWYVRSTNNTIETLRENNAQLQVTLDISEASNQQLREQAERNEELRATLEVNLQRAETYQDTLVNMLAEHDLVRLSTERPGLIERRVNNATKELFDDIESIGVN